MQTVKIGAMRIPSNGTAILTTRFNARRLRRLKGMRRPWPPCTSEWTKQSLNNRFAFPRGIGNKPSRFVPHYARTRIANRLQMAKVGILPGEAPSCQSRQEKTVGHDISAPRKILSVRKKASKNGVRTGKNRKQYSARDTDQGQHGAELKTWHQGRGSPNAGLSGHFRYRRCFSEYPLTVRNTASSFPGVYACVQSACV